MSDKKSEEVSGNDLKITGDSDTQFVEIGGLKIRLARPVTLPFDWVGEGGVIHEVLAAWFRRNDGDTPMNPRLVGKPGVGKTALAYSIGLKMDLPVFFFQATSDTEPNDVLINPVVVESEGEENKIEYFASALVSAMIVGGVCVFDEGNRMQEKAWAALAPLLDTRRYVDCGAVGIMIKANPDFRFVSTMNDDASCFDLPEYIKSRLQPIIAMDQPDVHLERDIIKANLSDPHPTIVDYAARYLEAARKEDEEFSVRDGIHIANYACKVMDFHKSIGETVKPGDAMLDAVEHIFGVRQARFMKRILWAEQNAAKDAA